jgi:hypothetical protein
MNCAPYDVAILVRNPEGGKWTEEIPVNPERGELGEITAAQSADYQAALRREHTLLLNLPGTDHLGGNRGGDSGQRTHLASHIVPMVTPATANITKACFGAQLISTNQATGWC